MNGPARKARSLSGGSDLDLLPAPEELVFRSLGRRCRGKRGKDLGQRLALVYLEEPCIDVSDPALAIPGHVDWVGTCFISGE